MEGKNLSDLYNEAGGHRIQRVPPTERKGRVHTSTVTVAVITPNINKSILKESDLKLEWYSGTGAGGQNRNKVKCSCRLTHIPTGLVQTAQTRSRENSYKLAYESMEQLLVKDFLRETHNSSNQIRSNQVGSGMRGDKIRTYRFQDDTVKDHLTGKNGSCTKILNGNFDLLW